MIKKIFHLWDKHTTGCYRALMVLMIPAAIYPNIGVVLCYLCLILWLIIKTGYEKGWDKEGGKK